MPPTVRWGDRATHNPAKLSWIGGPLPTRRKQCREQRAERGEDSDGWTSGPLGEWSSDAQFARRSQPDLIERWNTVVTAGTPI